MGQLPPELAVVVRLFLWIMVAGVLSVIVSFVMDGIVRVIDETCVALRRYRAESGRAADEGLDSFLDRFWARLQREPVAPVAAELQHLADIVRQSPAAAVRMMADVERDLARDVEALSQLNVAVASASQPEALAPGTEPSPGLGQPLLLLFFIGAFGVANSFLLSIYFKETLGAYRLLPYPLPDFQLAHVLALLFAVMEVATGFMFHYFESRQHRTVTSRLFGTIPWLAIGALMLIELFAYASLSTSIDLPTRLGIPESSAFYGLAQYFLAALGAVITLVLAGLGYMTWEAFRLYIEGRLQLRRVRALQDLPRAYSKVAKAAETAHRRCEAVASAASAIPVRLVEPLTLRLGEDDQQASLLGRAGAALDAVLSVAEPTEGHAGRVVRSRGQAVADLVVGGMTMAAWVWVVWLYAGVVGAYFVSRSGVVGALAGPAVPWIIAIAISLAGYSTRSAIAYPRHSTAGAAIPSSGTWWRTLVAAVGVTLLIAGAVTTAGILVRSRTLGASGALNSMFGAFLALALALLATNLDAALVSTVRILRAGLQGAQWLIMHAVGALILLVDVALLVVRQALRIVAVPGVWLRGRLIRREVGP